MIVVGSNEILVVLGYDEILTFLSIKARALNEKMLPMRRKINEKKNLTVSHTQHRAPPILTPYLPYGRNGEMRKKGPNIGSKKRHKKNRKDLKRLSKFD